MSKKECIRMSKLEELKATLVAELTSLRETAAKAEEEGRDFSAEEREEVSKRVEEIEKIKSQVKSIEESKSLTDQIKALGAEVTSNGNGSVDNGTKSFSTLGERFAAHVIDSLKGRQIGERTSIEGLIQPMAVGGMKDLVTGTGASSGGAFVFPQDLGLRDTGTFQRPLMIRDVITTGTTGTDSVEYVKVTGFTNAASPTAEATAASGTTGTKPESALTFIRASAPVVTIAHWVPITNRALSDAGQIRTIVDNFLRYGLEEQIEDQIISGTGTSEDFTGLSTLADNNEVQDQAWSTDLITTLRKARTLVATNGRARANAYLLNPADTERLDLATAASAGTYFYGGPANAAYNVPRVWGVPIVETEAVPSGFGYVGDFRQCVLWEREQASVSVGTINDQFVRNLRTILAEVRAAFGVFRPAAIVRIDLTA
jgi:HK97 family phage major capsid protein